MPGHIPSPAVKCKGRPSPGRSCNPPPLILADEPTGNLDSRTADQVLELLRNMAENHGSTVILVTHSREAAATADRVIELLDGQVVSDEWSG
ncbi:MAG: hypothetical protein QF879_13445 [Candidatus Latescibacteria bacterium]|nr:hypothetical protein [Candidatus Latescibacterota bacterium]